MSGTHSELTPPPREDDPDLARQMVAYAEPMQDELTIAQGTMIVQRARFASFVDKMTMMGQPGQPTAEDGQPIITGAGFPDVIGMSAIGRHLQTRSFMVAREVRWVEMLTAGAHFRAMHGRHDYLQGIDKTNTLNLTDLTCISWKERTLAGQRPSWSSTELFPDRIAVAGLIQASPEAAKEAHDLFSGSYSKPALELLRVAGIVQSK